MEMLILPYNINNSTGNVVYTVSDTSVATVSGSTVHIEGAGSTTIL